MNVNNRNFGSRCFRMFAILSLTSLSLSLSSYLSLSLSLSRERSRDAIKARSGEMQFGLHISCCNRFLARHVHPLAFCFDDYVNTGNEGNTSPRGLDDPMYIYIYIFPALSLLSPLPIYALPSPPFTTSRLRA